MSSLSCVCWWTIPYLYSEGVGVDRPIRPLSSKISGIEYFIKQAAFRELNELHIIVEIEFRWRVRVGRLAALLDHARPAQSWMVYSVITLDL